MSEVHFKGESHTDVDQSALLPDLIKMFENYS